MSNRRDGLDDRVTLLEAMLAIAFSDGRFGDEEQRRMEELMHFLRMGGKARTHIEELMARGEPPAMPAREELPAYDTRLYIFQQALMMAFEDGIIEDDERRHLDQLAELFELKPEHVQRGWQRAEEMSQR